MVYFKNINIKNFYSIKEVDYSFVNGIFKVEGYDKDNDTQNGAGKSTFSSAISQCLYNKSPKNPKSILEGTYNTITGSPYCITLDLSVGGEDYKIVNDRTRNNIFIYKNGTPLNIKGIKQQLEFIRDLVGVDYDTFNALTYLSQSSVSSVFDLTDTNNVLYKFFDIDTIKTLTTGLKTARRDLGKRKAFLESTIAEKQRLINSLERFEEQSTKEYNKKLEELEDTMRQLKDSQVDGKLGVIRHKKDTVFKSMADNKVKHAEMRTEYNLLKAQLDQLSTGVCPVCGTTVKDKTDTLTNKIEEIRTPLKTLTDAIKEQQELYRKLETEEENIEKVYNSNLREVQNEIQSTKNTILVIEEKNRHHKDLQKDLKSIKDGLNEVKADLNSVEKSILFVSSALEVIGKGLLTKSYIANFIEVFNKKILELAASLDMPFEVFVNEVSGSLKYNIQKNNHTITFNSLSSGERTRVSLVVLLAILESLELMTNIKFNVVIFDELLSVLDSSGVEVFKTVLNQYRNNKNVFVILHHDEITPEYFDGYVYLIKERGLTEMRVQNV